MRVTNQMMTNNMKLYLNQNMAAMIRSQDMLASGHRISKTSDDPIGAINTMRFSTNIVETEEYLEKIDQSTNFMETTDAALNNVNSVLHRVRELTVYAANGTQNDESREAIADEIEQLKEQLQLIANTTYGNKNIFSGTNVTTPPYNADNDIWVGNTDKLELEIGTGVKIQVNSSLQGFFYNTGTSMGGQAVDLTRLSDTDQLAGKSFTLVFDELQKKNSFVTINQTDIDDAGWGHPSADDFVKVVRSALPISDVLTCDTSGNFSLNGTQVYMQIGAITINNDTDLAKLQNHSDLTGNLQFFDDPAWTVPSTTPTVIINDDTNITNATGWKSSITRSQFNNIAEDMARTATASGYSLEYDVTAGTYTLDGKSGSLRVNGVEATNDYLQKVDDHTALVTIPAKSLTFVAADGTTTGLGTFDDSDLAVADWGLNPTSEQYKDVLQNAIDRSIGVMSGGKPKVLVEGTQDKGYTLQIMDQSLLPSDGSPAQVKVRSVGTENFGKVGYASAAMPLNETNLAQTVTSYFNSLIPAGKYMVNYDPLPGTQEFSLSVDGGTTYKTGNIILVDQAGIRQTIDVPAFLGTSPTASALLGKRIEFTEAGVGGNTWPVATPGQPYLATSDLKPAALLTMDNQQFYDNISALFNNLSPGHIVDVDNPLAPTQITGIDGIAGTFTIDGKVINNISTYLSDNSNDFSQLVGKEIVFTPDNSVVANNLITYVDAKTGVQTKENLALFTMGGQGIAGRGVRYQDDDIGLMQLLDRVIIDIKSGNHENIDSNLGVIDERMNTLNAERSLIGARVNRLDLQKDRMESSKLNYTALLSRYQDADMAQVIMDLNMQENVYRASLATGAKIIMPSLVDFL